MHVVCVRYYLCAVFVCLCSVVVRVYLKAASSRSLRCVRVLRCCVYLKAASSRCVRLCVLRCVCVVVVCT